MAPEKQKPTGPQKKCSGKFSQKMPAIPAFARFYPLSAEMFCALPGEPVVLVYFDCPMPPLRGFVISE